MKRIVVLLALVLTASGCAIAPVIRYSVCTENVTALRSLHEKKIFVGPFTATDAGRTGLTCRMLSRVITSDGEPFSEYIRKALIDDLRAAGVFSPDAPIILTANLDAIDFDSSSGLWNLQMTVKSSNGKSMVVTEAYSYTPLAWWAGIIQKCDQAAQALMPAVQNLVGKIVRSSEFRDLVSQ